MLLAIKPLLERTQMAASHVESWRDKTNLGHRFHGVIDDRDLAMAPQEVIERVKCELVSSIVNRIMQELGPRIDKAISDAWKEPSAPPPKPELRSFKDSMNQYINDNLRQ